MNLAEPSHPAFRIIDRLAGHAQPNTPAEIAAGIFAPQASISPKYFYDALGCRLFQAICELPEYYVTRTEAAVFDLHRDAIAAAVGTHQQLVDLGAGDCQKAACWFPALDPQRYVAVDVARGIVESALAEFSAEMPHTEFIGVIDDFSQTLNLDGVLGDAPVTFFYPGSSIGNFTPDQAAHFMAQTRKYCGQSGSQRSAGSGNATTGSGNATTGSGNATTGSGLLIGVDMVKDSATLERAYDDATGVTAAFNKNVLNHINRLAGGNFDPANVRHVGVFNAQLSRIEMHLEAIEAHSVTLAGRSRSFARGERIHTENSYKYTPQSFTALLNRAGFMQVKLWQDPQAHFAVFFATP